MMNSNKNNKKLKIVDNTAESYDLYFKTLLDLPAPRAHYRAKKGAELLSVNSGEILSIGIGRLAEAQELKNAGFNVTLCDISSNAVKYAQESGYNAFVCDITKDKIEDKYDYIFVLEVLEHLVNPLSAIENLKAAMTENGKLIISLPNEFNLRARLSILFGRPTFGGHDWHHLRFFNREFAEKMFNDSGLNVIKTGYCPLIPLWNKISIFVGEMLMEIMPNLFSLSTIWVLKK